MAPADVQSVGHVLAAAYSEVIVRLQGREWLSRYRARTREELEAQRSFFPSGCIVAESGGRIAGAIFARKWGSLGWFSALAVHPELQGRGIGKALAEAAIGELQRAGCIVVGMETWPNAADYTAMYIKMGFEPVGMTAVLMSPAERDWPRPDGCSVHLLDELPAGLAMQANQSARDICAKALAGMDVAVELESSRDHPLKGSVWLVVGGAVAGFALYDLAPDYDDSGAHVDMWFGLVDLTIARPEHFLAIAGRVAEEGRKLGCTKLDVEACTDSPHSYRFLLESGFRAGGQLLRFVRGSAPYAAAPDVLSFGRWSI